MAQVIVRNLDNEIKQRLKKRATEHGLSMEAEIRMILADILKEDKPASCDLGSRISNRFAQTGLDEPLPELHGEITPMDLR